MNYLIDTDWSIDYLNGSHSIRAEIERRVTDDLGISIVSVAELYEGAIYSRDPEAAVILQVFLDTEVVVLEIDIAICRIFGRERGRLRRIGQMIGDMDLMIAATCLRHDLTLLTNNRRHFERVDGQRLFRFESVSKASAAWTGACGPGMGRRPRD